MIIQINKGKYTVTEYAKLVHFEEWVIYDWIKKGLLKTVKENVIKVIVEEDYKKDIYTFIDYARKIGKHRDTVKRWIDSGYLKTTEFMGRTYVNVEIEKNGDNWETRNNKS